MIYLLTTVCEQTFDRFKWHSIHSSRQTFDSNQFCALVSFNFFFFGNFRMRWEKDRKKFRECCCFLCFILLLLFQIQLSSVRFSSIELRLFNSHKHAYTSDPFHLNISFNLSSECGFFFDWICQFLVCLFYFVTIHAVQASCRNFISVFSHYLSVFHYRRLKKHHAITQSSLCALCTVIIFFIDWSRIFKCQLNTTTELLTLRFQFQTIQFDFKWMFAFALRLSILFVFVEI